MIASVNEIANTKLLKLPFKTQKFIVAGTDIVLLLQNFKIECNK